MLFSKLHVQVFTVKMVWLPDIFLQDYRIKTQFYNGEKVAK